MAPVTPGKFCSCDRARRRSSRLAIPGVVEQGQHDPGDIVALGFENGRFFAKAVEIICHELLYEGVAAVQEEAVGEHGAFDKLFGQAR